MTTAVVAMSGGVDSSVAAALMMDAGYRVIGVTLDFSGLGQPGIPSDRDSNDRSYSVGSAVFDAAAVAKRLGFEHRVLHATEPFWEHVVQPSIDAYQAGRTPNPCLRCNQSIKFGYLLEQACQWGATVIATGHYARVDKSADGVPLLLRAVDKTKDQSYVLFMLVADERLAHIHLPLGGLTKPQVRKIAEERGLPSASRGESQDLCFPLKEFLPDADGTIVDTSGLVLGTHRGINHFTIGQRQGLGVASSRRLYVVELRPETNEVVIGPDEALFKRCASISSFFWTPTQPQRPTHVMAKIRYNHEPAPATIVPGNGTAIIEFEKPQRAITPGQAAVCYIGEQVLAGGWIDCAFDPEQKGEGPYSGMFQDRPFD